MMKIETDSLHCFTHELLVIMQFPKLVKIKKLWHLFSYEELWYTIYMTLAKKRLSITFNSILEVMTSILSENYLSKYDGLSNMFFKHFMFEAVLIVLKSVFEPHFYYFCNNLSIHRIHLKQICSSFKIVFWVIKGSFIDFINKFNSIILISIWQKIKDVSMFRLVNFLIKSKIFSFSSLVKSDKSMFVTSISKNFFLNLILDPFDFFLMKIANICKVKSDMTYVSCGVSFLIGLVMPYSLVLSIQSILFLFVKQKFGLFFSLDKNMCIFSSKQKIPFLGFYLKFYVNSSNPIRSYDSSVYLFMDLKKVIASLAYKGFCDIEGSPLPNFNYFRYTQEYTIFWLRKLLTELAFYYSIADDFYWKMSKVSYIMRHSIAKMFAAKYKLKRSSLVFKRAGKDLSKSI